MGFLKNFSQFGSAVWPAISMCEELDYFSLKIVVFGTSCRI